MKRTKLLAAKTLVRALRRRLFAQHAADDAREMQKQMLAKHGHPEVSIKWILRHRRSVLEKWFGFDKTGRIISQEDYAAFCKENDQ